MFKKKIYLAAGYNTTYIGTGRKEFDPSKPMRPFEEYLQESAKGTADQIDSNVIDEGIIGSFMSARFLKQANLPGFLPFILPTLKGKPCVAVEGACGTGGRAIAMGMRSVLSDMADGIFVIGFEIQNTVKSVYGADILAGAGYYNKQRKTGQAFFFPGLFSDRAGAYFAKYGENSTRQGMAKWYEQSILNARKNPKAQEYHNTSKDLFTLGLTPPNPHVFVPHLNLYDCSKVSDGASSLMVLSEEGIQRAGLSLSDVVEVVAIGEAEDDITQPPVDLTRLSTTQRAVELALERANMSRDEISILEIHDCFTITAILAFEALGFAEKGRGAQWILEGHARDTGWLPTNLSGGLGGFGHPTGATGVRQAVDLLHQLTGHAANQVTARTPYSMLISMGGDDKTVTCLIVRRPS